MGRLLTNGSSLGLADEDNVPNDCYLWNNQGKALTSGMPPNQGAFPTSTQAVVTLSGSGGNPLGAIWRPNPMERQDNDQ
jgi:hypothetical protein